MDFSSIPVYQLDPPNGQQHPPGPKGVVDHNHPQLPSHLMPPPPPPPSRASRPNSMAERARLTNMPQPNIGQKCPRCESTNTKFCYYNNYSLSQPRHFCKMCRRYWTRGGALRNVPVGGGFRRNKKSKRSSRSRSPVPGSSTSGISSSSCTTDFIGHVVPTIPQFPFLPPLHSVTDFGGGDIGLSFGAITQLPATGTTTTATGGFPFLAGLESPAGVFQYQSEDVEASNCVGEISSQSGIKTLDCGISQISCVKFEENDQGVNLPKNFLGFVGNDHHQYWSSSNNAWSTTDLNGFTSSSSAFHLL